MVDVAERWQSVPKAESHDAVRFQGFIGSMFERRQKLALGRCLKKIGQVSALMDLPKGTGRMFPLLEKFAGSLVACDVSKGMMQQVRERMAGHENIRYLVAALRGLLLS